jgi:hypothetical protein
MLLAVKSFELGEHTQTMSLQNALLQVQCYSEKFENYSWGIMVIEKNTEKILFNKFFENETLRYCLNAASMANHTWYLFRSIDFVEGIIEERLRESSNLENDFNL